MRRDSGSVKQSKHRVQLRVRYGVIHTKAESGSCTETTGQNLVGSGSQGLVLAVSEHATALKQVVTPSAMSSEQPLPETLSGDGVHVELTYAHLDVTVVMNTVKSPKAGATVLFAGLPKLLLSVLEMSNLSRRHNQG